MSYNPQRYIPPLHHIRRNTRSVSGGIMGTINPMYATTVTVTGGREGHAVSDDGVLDVQLRRPKLNGVSEGTNPEQLFAAAWGGCFQSALMAVARKSGDDVSASTVNVEV